MQFDIEKYVEFIKMLDYLDDVLDCKFTSFITVTGFTVIKDLNIYIYFVIKFSKMPDKRAILIE